MSEVTKEDRELVKKCRTIIFKVCQKLQKRSRSITDGVLMVSMCEILATIICLAEKDKQMREKLTQNIERVIRKNIDLFQDQNQ